MKVTVYSLFVLIIFLFSCQKNLPIEDDKNSIVKSRSNIMEIDYELQLYNTIELNSEGNEDLCDDDMYILTNVSQLWIVHAEIDSINPCLDIDRYTSSNDPNANSSSGRSRESNGVNYDFESNTNICNGVLSYSGIDTSYTTTMQGASEFWGEMIQYYNKSEEENSEEFLELYQNAVDYGKIVSETETTVSIREQDRFGNEIITTYSKDTFLELQVVTNSPNGEQYIQIFNYTCSADGEIIPASIISISQEISPLCKEAYTKKEIQKFNHYQIRR